MPPKQKTKAIVKSGNAGNSSKSKEKTPQDTSNPHASESKPLFPPGSKYPASLLMERCQKNGWDKPIIDTPRKGDGYAFSVTLRRVNKKSDSGMDTVRLEPHPPYIRPSALEARHWGATYALYRFCNGIQLQIVLPKGPRDYWIALAAEHRLAPPHQHWMYEADPFNARKEVNERQAKAAKKKEAAASDSRAPYASSTPNEFSNCPEVRMSANLRAVVEEGIKKAIALSGDTHGNSNTLSETDQDTVQAQLQTLGFNLHQIRKAVDFFSVPSPLSGSLLATLSPLQASLEYLVLNLPECDLPRRFLPDQNSSNPFITSGHSGTDDLKQRWIKDKAIKEAGWPPQALQSIPPDSQTLQSFENLVATLCQRLIGANMDLVQDSRQSPQPYIIGDEELTALGAFWETPSHLVMPLFSAPIHLHILLSPGQFPSKNFTPMYLTSDAVPAYVRLHLLSHLLQAMQTMDPVSEDLCMFAMRALEDEWELLEANGPPNISEVMKNLVDQPRIADQDPVDVTATPTSLPSSRGHRRQRGKGDPRSDAQVKQEFENLCKNAKYREILEARKRLPAFQAKQTFLDSLDQNRVVVVIGETGSGKTTQLPQYILDSLILSGSGSQASIIVTQPRRISAISVSERVHHERIQDGSVGFAIRGESKYDPAKTKLLLCTTGVVLRRLSNGDKFDNVTHIVVDEVHERSVDCDFLLLELKELVKHHPTLKIVLMSATVNYNIFTKYFDGAPLITIPGVTHPVLDMYLEDIIPKIGYRPSMTGRGKVDKGGDDDGLNFLQGLDEDDTRVVRTLNRSNTTDFQLIAKLVAHITSSGKPAAILIFLPGVQEIRHCVDAIRSTPSNVSDIYPLHSNLSSEEQMRAFSHSKSWKVVVATNIAETSVTIDDVVYVIDSGKFKENAYNPELGFTALKETWISKAAARQRRGRAGRTQPGTCFKLYTRWRESQFEDFPVPEMLRVPLENVLLTVKAMRPQEDIQLYLNRALDPPNTLAIRKALNILTDLGALDSGSLTSLGRHLSMLPLDLRLGKLLILGSVFQCVDPILSVTAILSAKPLFFSPVDQREEATRSKFICSSSDLLTDVNAYTEVITLRAVGKSQGETKQFCDQNFISPTTIREVTTLRNEFMAALSDIGFVPFKASPSEPAINTNSKNRNLIKAIITGALWPQVARVHLPVSAIKFDKVQAGAVQRENTAKEYRFYNLRGERVFLHPSSILFDSSIWSSDFVAYFQQQMTTKPFIRNVTEVPVYGLLLFGGALSINHILGGLSMAASEGDIKLKAWPRIGVLVNQLRQLLDTQLGKRFEAGGLLYFDKANPVTEAMLTLLANNGREL